MAWLSIFKLSVQHVDWHQPWCWPRAVQNLLFVGAGVCGVLLLSPWWLHNWQALDEANAAQAKLQAQQDAIQALHAQTAQLLQEQQPFAVPLADAAVLTQLAQQQGLQFSEQGVDKPLQSAALNALQIQQLPMHFKVHGAWDSWLHWLAQWPVAAPGVTVASLEIKADASGSITAQVLEVAPQSTSTESTFELSKVNLESANANTNANANDPFNAQAWVSAQRAYAAQQPSYLRLVAPELLRARDVLEAFPRERLQYVGHIASGAELEGLIRVVPPEGAKKEAAMMSVYRVRLGQRLGQDFGKVLAVRPEHLMLQELALTAAGQWQTREVRLPLQEASP